MIEFLGSLGHIIVAAIGTFIVAISSVLPISSPSPLPSPTSTPLINFIDIYSEYRYLNNEAKISLKIPENGGAVTGEIKGICNGIIEGNYDGLSSLSGTAKGTCLVIPASGTWSGNIDKTSKKVLLKYQGGGAGFSKSGEITSSY